MVKKFQPLVISKLKKIKFYRQKRPIFLGNIDTENTLISNKISFGEKNYKYFIGYMYHV